MTLYEAIFVRRSVRQYEKMPLDVATLLKVENYLEGVKQLPNHSARFEIIGNDELKGGFFQHAIVVYADDEDWSCVNIGYTLQGVDLWLQSIGYGSIWSGMAKPRKNSPDYRMLLGFGKTEVPFRNGENDFKRKQIMDISNEDNAIARAGRLAPSAVNFQPWKLNFGDGIVTVQLNVRGVGKVLPGKSYLFDLGIIIKHIELALEHNGFTVISFTPIGDGSKSAVEIRYA